MASRLYEILRKDVFSDIETGPRFRFRCLNKHHLSPYTIATDWYVITKTWASDIRCMGNESIILYFQSYSFMYCIPYFSSCQAALGLMKPEHWLTVAHFYCTSLTMRFSWGFIREAVDAGIAVNVFHDDIITRKPFMHNWPFARGIHRWLVYPITQRASYADLWFFFWY